MKRMMQCVGTKQLLCFYMKDQIKLILQKIQEKKLRKFIVSLACVCERLITIHSFPHHCLSDLYDLDFSHTSLYH